MKSRLLSVLQTEVLQGIGLLLVLILLLAAQGFSAAQPALTAALVFLFSVPYLVAAIVTRRAHFLYAAMLLGAASYFMVCHALGAAPSAFPLLSVPLVLALWIVGRYLAKRMPRELGAFPQTTFRAMNITAAAFATWAVYQMPSLTKPEGTLPQIAGATLLCYGILYLAHSASLGSALYAYVSTALLMAGACLAGTAILGLEFAWAFLLPAALVIAFIGARFHQRWTFRWARHLYLCFTVFLFGSMALAFVHVPFVLYNLAAVSLSALLVYRWLASAVGDVRGATTNERLAARLLFLGSMAAAVPLVPFLLLRPLSLNTALPSFALGAAFALLSWQRRAEDQRQRSPYPLASVLFIAPALCWLLSRAPGALSVAGPGVASLVLILALGGLHAQTRLAPYRALRRSLAEAAAIPALFAWYIPLFILGNPAVALGGAAAAAAAALTVSVFTGNRFFRYAVGSSGAGLVVAGVQMAGTNALEPWAAYIAVAGLLGWGYVWASAHKASVTRQTTHLGWLILTGASLIAAAGAGAPQVFFAATASGCIAIVMTGLSSRREGSRDAFAHIVSLTAVLTAAAVPFLIALRDAPFLDGAVGLLLLGLSCGLAWAAGRGRWMGRTWVGLTTGAALLFVFALTPDIEIRLLAGAGITLALFAVAAALQQKQHDLSRSGVVAGHTASLVFGSTVLMSAWDTPVGMWTAMSAALYAALHALMPRLRRQVDFRIAASCWLSFAALLGLAAVTGGPYREHILAAALLALFWLFLARVAQRAGAKGWVNPLYASATALALAVGVIGLYVPVSHGAWLPFLLCGVVFASLFLILRQDIFAYLVTLSLSLMAYDWVRESTSHFTQDVLFYPLVVVALLSIVFLLPYLKMAANRLGALPVFAIFSWQGAAFAMIPVLGVGLMLSSAFSLKVTAHPRFCTSCHYMDEYYESWQHSSHKDVACVECHYDPGIANEVIGKGEGFIQLIKYVSHTYTNRPHGIVNNASCTRAGCHDTVEDNGEVLLFGGKIRFRHDTHLSSHPRGKTLNCVSCHGQMVQGKHISVTETTCLTCHFYGRGDKPVAVGDCLSCHAVLDETVKLGEQTFDHPAFLANKSTVQCIHCHSQVTQGDGSVSPVRCRSCHLDTFGPIEDQEAFHLIHVSKKHFDCLQCHDEIKHGTRPMDQQMQLSSSACEECHTGERHTIQERTYAGTSVPDIEAEPDFMYTAGVTCEGCHTDAHFVRVGEMTLTSKASGAKQCAGCHDDESYAEILVDWQEETKGRIDALQPLLDGMAARFTSPNAPAEAVQAARQLLDSAKMKLTSVVLDGSLGAHNYFYTSSILDSAESDAEACRALMAEWPETTPEEAQREMGSIQ